ncbi:hypothetical protein MTO96_049991, partial [Rhipicephalus appendiculatus]
PTVAFLAEYDALPDIGHGCGHNLIAENAIGAAIAVRDTMKKLRSVRGKVVVLGTPAEESCGGKQLLVEKGGPGRHRRRNHVPPLVGETC